MRLAFLPLVAVIAAIACANTPTTQKPGTAGQAPTGQQAGPRSKEPETVIKVRVVVAPLTSLQEQCKGKSFQPSDILIDEDPTQKEPYHCIGLNLMRHNDVDKKFPVPPDNPALVRVSRGQGQSVLWYSDNIEFAIVGIEPQHPQNQQQTAGPPNPFPQLNIPTPLSKSIPSGPLSEFFAKPKSDHQYKMLLRIGKDRNIDPDVWCQP